MSTNKKAYLGDGLYAEDEGFQIKLYTPDGLDKNEVYLDDQTLQSFLAFIEKAKNVKIKVIFPSEE